MSKVLKSLGIGTSIIYGTEEKYRAIVSLVDKSTGEIYATLASIDLDDPNLGVRLGDMARTLRMAKLLSGTDDE